MAFDLRSLALNVDSPLVEPTAANYRPTSWPPDNDFPIILDAQGKVVSRYGDPIWNLAPWAKTAMILNFGDGPQRRGAPSITPENADLLRAISAWWLYGPRAIRTPATLLKRHGALRPLFSLCSEKGITASDLYKFAAVADELPSRLTPSSAEETLLLLRSLYEQRNTLNFCLLDAEGLRRLEAALPEHEGRQTPYIPPRIWLYQVNRLRMFLDDFLTHRTAIEACFRFCLDSYITNYGSLAQACLPVSERTQKREPFCDPEERTGERSGAVFHGPFSLTARRFGIESLLQRWILGPGESLDGAGRGVRLMSYYFNMASKVGLAYVLNFSLMRVGEAWDLRSSCLEIEQDERFGPIHLLRGATSKMLDDDDARWVVSPSVTVALDVMTDVARLRMLVADGNPAVPSSAQDVADPYLILRAYEPWVNSGSESEPIAIRPIYPSYQALISNFPNLLDPEQLRITEEDLQLARVVTPSLDNNRFAIGEVWPLAWHQLRRTGAVNMQASGIVSSSSLQYQLKHVSRAMSLYYGQGYSQASLNKNARITYLRTMYEVVGMEVARLFSDRFVSPHGPDRKAAILAVVSPSESKKLSDAARNGEVSWRETLLGGCAKRGPCEYGGIDNFIRCGGGDGQAPCVDALFDRDRIESIRGVGRLIASRLVDAPVNSPERDSLNAQQRAVENAINVLAQ